jgi:hypothetical protein
MAPVNVLMWEVRAAEGRLDELVAYVDEHADRQAQLFCSGDPEPRVVLLDPSGHGVPDVPPALIARPAHQWSFEHVQR